LVASENRLEVQFADGRRMTGKAFPPDLRIEVKPAAAKP
jgi:hypothetical protein